MMMSEYGQVWDDLAWQLMRKPLLIVKIEFWCLLLVSLGVTISMAIHMYIDNIVV